MMKVKSLMKVCEMDIQEFEVYKKSKEGCLLFQGKALSKDALLHEWGNDTLEYFYTAIDNTDLDWEIMILVIK